MASDSGSTELKVVFAYRPRRILPHPLDTSNHGHVAFARGPFVYCAETIDNPAISDLRALRIPNDASAEEVIEQEAFALWQLKDVVSLKVGAVVVGKKDGDEIGKEHEVAIQVKLVPVALWANRGKSDMRVWLPRRL